MSNLILGYTPTPTNTGTIPDRTGQIPVNAVDDSLQADSCLVVYKPPSRWHWVPSVIAFAVASSWVPPADPGVVGALLLFMSHL